MTTDIMTKEGSLTRPFLPEDGWYKKGHFLLVHHIRIRIDIINELIYWFFAIKINRNKGCLIR